MIEACTYSIHFIILIICWYFILKSTTPRLIPTIHNYFFLFFTSFIYIGSVFVFIENGCSNWVFIVSVWCFSLFFSISTTFFYTAQLKIRDRAVNFIDMSITTPYPKEVVRLFAIILFLIGLIYLFRYISIIGISKLPLYYVLTFSDSYTTSTIAHLREQSTKFGYYSDFRWIFRYLIPLSFFLFYGLWRANRDAISKVLCVLVLPVTIFCLTMTFEKAAIAQFLLMWWVINFYLSGGKKIKVKSNLCAFAAIFLILSFIIAVKNKAFEISYDQYVSRAVLSMIDRITLGQVGPAYTYFDIFPHPFPFLGGLSFPNPLGILPYEPFDITSFVFWIMHTESTSLGTAPTVFFTEFYANFGIIGVFLSSIFVILFFMLFSLLFYDKSKSVAKIIFGVFVMQEAASLAISTLISGFLLPILLRIGFLFFLYFIFVNIVTRAVRSTNRHTCS